MRTRDSSAFSRAISICSAVTAVPRTSPSRPAASALTQLSSDCPDTPSVRAIADTFSPPCPSPTASRLNSNVQRDYTPSFILIPLR